MNFDFDKATIRADARPVLDEAINILKSEGGIAVIAEGHTDSVGTDAYNKRLSERRSRAVKDYLVKGGISASRASRPSATVSRSRWRRTTRRMVGPRTAASS